MSLPRFHLFELEDQSWFPALWRDFMTDYLHEAEVRMGLYRHALDPLKRLVERARAENLVDLCSGAGGPLPALLGELSRDGLRVTATQTDLYPHAAAAPAVVEASGGLIRYRSEPVDATSVPPELTGARTLFNGLHHFRPSKARRILADAARASTPIGVFEVAERRVAAIAPLVLVPLVVWAMTPLIRPFRWSRLLWTYLIPVLPLAILWDGVVSYLRAYTPDELIEMAQEAAPDYHWETGYGRDPQAPGRMTYLIGFPPTAREKEAASRRRG